MGKLVYRVCMRGRGCRRFSRVCGLQESSHIVHCTYCFRTMSTFVKLPRAGAAPHLFAIVSIALLVPGLVNSPASELLWAHTCWLWLVISSTQAQHGLCAAHPHAVFPEAHTQRMAGSLHVQMSQVVGSLWLQVVLHAPSCHVAYLITIHWLFFCAAI